MLPREVVHGLGQVRPDGVGALDGRGCGPVAVACRHVTGLSTIVWGNDYPHAEGTFRGSQEVLAQQMAGVPDDERRAMVGGTLVDLLGLRPTPVPA